MSRRLAPLGALRAFEAAARHLSFSRAADELHVTPAAISHRIRALEDHFGIALFRRVTRAVLLTEEGQLLYPGLREGFDQLEDACSRLRDAGASGLLTVTAPPSLASKWLVPRLEHFRETHPEIDVRLDAAERIEPDLGAGSDVMIVYGRGEHPGLRVDRISQDLVFPVCSPDLVSGPRPLRTPADLAVHRLIHTDSKRFGLPWPTWAQWLRAAGVSGVAAQRGLRFTVSSMALQAAIAGQGVALGSGILCVDDLEAGWLVQPFDLHLDSGFAYYLACPERLADSPKVTAFRAWILAEAEDLNRRGPGRQVEGA